MRLIALILATLLFAGPSQARDIAGRFDYYVLALSWQPGWCSSTGDDRAAPECRDGTGRASPSMGSGPRTNAAGPAIAPRRNAIRRAAKARR